MPFLTLVVLLFEVFSEVDIQIYFIKENFLPLTKTGLNGKKLSYITSLSFQNVVYYKLSGCELFIYLGLGGTYLGSYKIYYTCSQ